MFGHDVFGDDLTAKALDMCKKTVLHPYLAFLKVVSPSTMTSLEGYCTECILKFIRQTDTNNTHCKHTFFLLLYYRLAGGGFILNVMTCSLLSGCLWSM